MRLFLEAARRIDEQDSRLKQMAEMDEIFQSSLDKGSEVKLNKDIQAQDFTLYETGQVMGIHLGKTLKDQAVQLLEKYSVEVSVSPKMILVKELTLSIFFEDDCATEINIGSLYPGETSKGLKIGNTVDKAVTLYGPPKLSSNKGVLWESISVFSQDGASINSIRLSQGQ